MKSFRIGDLTIPVPVVQGGMGIGISISGLASAVFAFSGAKGYNIKSITTVKKVFEHLKNEFYHSINPTVNSHEAT